MNADNANSKRWRNIVSRAALLTLGAVLMWGGVASLRAAASIYRDEAQRRERFQGRRSGGGFVLPGAVGMLLAGAGGLLIFGGIAPMSLLYRITHRAPSLHDNPDASNPRGPWR